MAAVDTCDLLIRDLKLRVSYWLTLLLVLPHVTCFG